MSFPELATERGEDGFDVRRCGVDGVSVAEGAEGVGDAVDVGDGLRRVLSHHIGPWAVGDGSG